MLAYFLVLSHLDTSTIVQNAYTDGRCCDRGDTHQCEINGDPDSLYLKISAASGGAIDKCCYKCTCTYEEEESGKLKEGCPSPPCPLRLRVNFYSDNLHHSVSETIILYNGERRSIKYLIPE